MEFYDREGNPISMEEWMDLTRLSERDYNRIAWDELPGGVTVSTVYVGLGTGEPPNIYETMVFRGSEPILTFRYPTRAEAEAGHVECLTSLSSQMN